MDFQERVGWLRRIDLFHSFSDAELHDFARKVTETTRQEGDILFKEGEPGSEMFILLEGELQVFKESRIIAVIRSGDYVGEMAIIETKPRSATVLTMAPSRLLVVDREQFQEYLARQPQSLVSMMKTLSGRIRQDTEVIGRELQRANILIHDMRNQLSAFLYLDTVRKEVSTDKARRAVGFMDEARRNLLAMMDEALAVAKRRCYAPRIVADSLGTLIMDLVEGELAVHPDMAGKTIGVEIDPALPAFPFCRLDIRRVLANLLVNAAQASLPGGNILVSALLRKDAAEVRVHDEGCGIPEAIRGKLFTPHFTTKEQGNGLGLASCREIIEERHGGTITFTSEPGQGTTFLFLLPLAEPA